MSKRGRLVSKLIILASARSSTGKRKQGPPRGASRMGEGHLRWLADHVAPPFWRAEVAGVGLLVASWGRKVNRGKTLPL